MATSELITERTELSPRARPATSEVTWYRLGAASGLVFITLFVVLIAISPPFPPETDAGILSYAHDPGVQARVLADFFLVVFAFFFLLWFLSTMRASLPTGGPGTEALAQLAFIGGVVTAVMFLVDNAAERGIVASVVTSGHELQLDPNTVRVVGGVAYLGFVTANIASAVWVGSAATHAIVTRTFPIWLSVLGLIGAASQLLIWFTMGIGGVVVLIWIAITSVLMIRRGPHVRAQNG